MGRRTRRRSRKAKPVLILVAFIIVAIALAGAYLAIQGYGSGNRGGNDVGSPLSISLQNPVLGLKTAPYTIFEFGDFQCPSCGYWFRTQGPMLVHNLVDNGKAKLVWRDFIIYNSDSRVAASAAYAAGEQGKFWEFHDLLYSNQGQANSGWVTKQLMMTFAQRLGLNLTAFNQSMNSGKYDSLIDSNFQAGQQLGAGGTPTFVVVGPTGQHVIISGPQPESVFQQAINSLGG